MSPADAAVAWLCSAAYCDSLVILNPNKIRAALAEDGELPTKEECDLLVMGGEDGEVPSALIERFPTLCDYLQSEWE